MTARARLIVASIALAVFWTLVMIWSTGAEPANIVIMSISGALVGLLWYFAMRWWMGRRVRD
jgi:hypothetical protein